MLDIIFIADEEQIIRVILEGEDSRVASNSGIVVTISKTSDSGVAAGKRKLSIFTGLLNQ